MQTVCLPLLTRIRLCIVVAAACLQSPRVSGELKIYLDRGSLSTWVTKHGILHKTQLAYFDNDSSLLQPGGSFALKQATTVSMVRLPTSVSSTPKHFAEEIRVCCCRFPKTSFTSATFVPCHFCVGLLWSNNTHDTCSRDHIVLIQVFELVCAGTPHYFQASNTAEWVYYILEMLKKRAGDEAEANKAQSALSTSGQPSHCDVQTRSCGELCSTCFASVASLTLLNA